MHNSMGYISFWSNDFEKETSLNVFDYGVTIVENHSYEDGQATSAFCHCSC